MGTADRRGMSGSALKLIAAGCMLIDHTAWAVVPTVSPLGFLLHLIGRVTAPVMCFMMAEGYRHTHSFNRYFLRVAVFAAVSYLPFLYFQTGGLPDGGNFLTFNMLYTLALCLLALKADEMLTGPDKAAALFLLVFLSLFGDWPVAAVLFTLNFSRNRRDFKRMARNHFWITAGFTLVFGSVYWQMGLSWGDILGDTLFQFGTLLALPLLRAYNGRKGRNIGGKWFFYIFYPAHLLALGLLRWAV